MRVLVACEESQIVCKAFRAKGHEAYSCDIIDCSGGHPEWHIKADVLEILKLKWDMIIAFPPCTYLSNAGANHLFKNKVLNTERYAKGLAAKVFFMKILNSNCHKIVIENPVPSKIYGLPEKTQIIQPYYFGDPFLKRTYLWLKGVSRLNHVKENNLFNEKVSHVKPLYYHVSSSCKKNGKLLNIKAQHSAKERSKTFPGIAAAMAEQWG